MLNVVVCKVTARLEKVFGVHDISSFNFTCTVMCLRSVVFYWEKGKDCSSEQSAGWNNCNGRELENITNSYTFSFELFALVGLRPSACWDRGFESHPEHGYLSCTLFVLSGRDLCDGPIPHPEESYRLWCVSECDQMKSQKTLNTYSE
jgi:hypothetical protein